MSFRLSFSGHIKKADHKNLGGKPMVEFTLCHKNKTKEGEEDSFTWVRVACWEPAPWQAPKLIAGAFVTGSGPAILRSYKNKEGVKAQSLDVRCSSFDIDMPDERKEDPQAAAHVAAAATAPRRPASPPADDSEPPF